MPGLGSQTIGCEYTSQEGENTQVSLIDEADSIRPLASTEEWKGDQSEWKAPSLIALPANTCCHPEGNHINQ
eukprot:1157713-Pelagomonas_calceolata.AAC.4